jgi:hypothetical protein
VNVLKKYTKAGFPIYNLVVFGKNTDLNQISDGLNQKVINIRQLNKSIHKLSDLLDNGAESSELVSIKDKIIRDNITDKKLRKNHVKSIKKRYQK